MQESGEMYLETILVLSQSKPHVRSIDIAEHMGYSKPSVSRAVSKLKEDNCISVDENGYITFLEKGRRIAEMIYERHIVISTFFEEIGVSSQTAVDDACRIEHVISDSSFQAVKNVLARMKENEAEG